MRCEECGEVRWILFGRLEDADHECPACGAEMRDERRHPGTHRGVPGVERREQPDFEQLTVS